MPIIEFSTRIRPNRPSAIDPVMMINTNSAPRIALNRVSTLALTISQTLRDELVSTALVCPSAVRRATSSEVSPADGSVAESRVEGG